MAGRQVYHSINTADSDALSAQTGARIGALLKNRPLPGRGRFFYALYLSSTKDSI